MEGYDAEEMRALSAGVLNDPELLSELKGLGWQEDGPSAPAAPAAPPAAAAASAPAQQAVASTADRVAALKKRALALKKAGDGKGALDIFKQAKKLEKEAGQAQVPVPASAPVAPAANSNAPSSQVAESLAKANEILKQTSVEVDDVELEDGEEDSLEGELASIMSGGQSMDSPAPAPAPAPAAPAAPAATAPARGGGGDGGEGVCKGAIMAKKQEMMAAGQAKNFPLVRKLRAEIKTMEATLQNQPAQVTAAASAAFVPSENLQPAAPASQPATRAGAAAAAVERTAAAATPASAHLQISSALPTTDVPAVAPAPKTTEMTPPQQASVATAGAEATMAVRPMTDWDLQEAILAKRKEAIMHHKAGRSTEAKRALLEAKRLEATQNALVGMQQSPQSVPTPPPPPQPQALLNAANATGWNELEEALQAAIRDCASRVDQGGDGGGGDGSAAATAAVKASPSSELARRQNAHYRGLLDEARKRRLIPGSVAPSFQMTRELGPETEVVLSHLRSDELQVRVLSLGDMIDDEGQRLLVEVEMERSLLKDEKAPCTAKSKSAKVTGGACTWGAIDRAGQLLPKTDNNAPPAVFSFQLKRNKSTARTFKRKTLDFRLKVETKGLFKNKEEVIAEGKVPLSSLIAKCALRDRAKVTLPKQQRKQRRGEVTLELNLHHPIGQDGDGKEVTQEPITVLRVSPWESHAAPAGAGAGAASAAKAVPHAEKTLSVSSTPAGGAKPRSALRSGGGGGGGGGDDISARQLAKLNEEFSELKQSERISPTSGAHVISMAVIEAELTQQGISQHRKQELEIALVTITTNHANGFLTPVAYMQNLENRIGRDRYIMQYLMKLQIFYLPLYQVH